MIVAILMAMLQLVVPNSNTYNAWTDTGIHIVLDDNGTPGDFDDDWVVDWEDNRSFVVVAND